MSFGKRLERMKGGTVGSQASLLFLSGRDLVLGLPPVAQATVDDAAGEADETGSSHG